MKCWALTIDHEREWSQAGVTAVVDKSRFVAIKTCINTEWEKAVLECLVYFLLVWLVVIIRIVHVKQITAPNFIVVGASDVTVFVSDYLTLVLCHKGTSWDIFFGKETPHFLCQCSERTTFLYSRSDVYFRFPDNKFPFVRIVLVYQSVQAIVFVAAAGRGTLVEIKVRV